MSGKTAQAVRSGQVFDRAVLPARRRPGPVMALSPRTARVQVYPGQCTRAVYQGGLPGPGIPACTLPPGYTIPPRVHHLLHTDHRDRQRYPRAAAGGVHWAELPTLLRRKEYSGQGSLSSLGEGGNSGRVVLLPAKVMIPGLFY